MGWKEEAKKLKFIDGLSWRETTSAIKEKYFPDAEYHKLHERIRTYLRNTPEYKETKKEDYHRSCIEYKSDGSIISKKFITVRDGEDMTPDFMIEAHGLKPSMWEVVNYKNNFWNTQLKGGKKQISYQSKLSVRPRKQGLDLEEIDKHFAKLDRTFKQPTIKPIHIKGNYMAEVNIADVHLGKLCWRGDTGNNYDYKIAREVFYKVLNEICNEIQDKKLEYITFVWANDFFNSDTIDKTTTGGTPQDTDVRWQKLFNVGVEMLVTAVSQLSAIAKVKTFYTPSNHDELTGYHALKYLEAWFRHDDNVEIDTSAMIRKYMLYGKTLIGYTHGDKEKGQNGSKEKASKLASVMPLEAKDLWSKANYYEMHTAHLHSEHAIHEINGVIVRRISSPTATDTWHKESGYIGAVRKVQTFIYEREKGLLQTINTPVV